MNMNGGNGYKNAGRAMGAIFSGDAFRQGAIQEEKRLTDIDNTRANAQYRLSLFYHPHQKIHGIYNRR